MRGREGEGHLVCVTTGSCPCVLATHLPRHIHCLLPTGWSPDLRQRSVISSFLVWAEATGPVSLSSVVRWSQLERRPQRSTEYLRPPGCTGENNSCFGDEALLFSALVRFPFSSPPLVYSSPGPRALPGRLGSRAFSFKRQMQKLCVDVSVWEWACRTPGETENTAFSKVSI